MPPSTLAKSSPFKYTKPSLDQDQSRCGKQNNTIFKSKKLKRFRGEISLLLYFLFIVVFQQVTEKNVNHWRWNAIKTFTGKKKKSFLENQVYNPWVYWDLKSHKQKVKSPLYNFIKSHAPTFWGLAINFPENLVFL